MIHFTDGAGRQISLALSSGDTNEWLRNEEAKDALHRKIAGSSFWAGLCSGLLLAIIIAVTIFLIIN